MVTKSNCAEGSSGYVSSLEKDITSRPTESNADMTTSAPNSTESSYPNELIAENIETCDMKESVASEMVTSDPYLRKTSNVHIDCDPDTPIVGECTEMCPMSEIRHRAKDKRIHILEATEESKKNRILEPNPLLMVKEFGRSAAAVHPDPKTIRTIDVLEKTVDHLITRITPINDMEWNIIYDFVFDRLRAVRQELVMQRITGPRKIAIIEKIVLFHVYAAYKLSPVEFRKFDPTINRQHLSECLNILVELYDTDQSHRRRLSPRTREKRWNRRAYFEAIFILHNLTEVDMPLARHGFISDYVKEVNVYQQAYKCGIAMLHGNYCRILSSIPKLHAFLAMTISQHIPLIHLKYLQILNKACSSTQSKVSITTYLYKVLVPFTTEKAGIAYVTDLCESLTCEIDGWENVRFDKTNRMLTPEMTFELVRDLRKCHWKSIEEKYKHEKIDEEIKKIYEGAFTELRFKY